MTIAISMPHTESGITVNFPVGSYYQFEACPHYQKVSNQTIKEMDFIWYENTQNTLWLIELKGFFDPTNEKHQATDLSVVNVLYKKLNELETKAQHSLIMLNTQRTNLHQCVNFEIKTQKIKLVFVIEVMPSQLTYLSFIKDELQNRMQAYITLFKVESIIVVNQQIGRNAGLTWLI